MLSSSPCLSLAVLLTVLCSSPGAPESSLNNNKPVGGHSDGTRCCWYCTTVDSEFLEEMMNKIAKKKVIRLVVKYEKRVYDNCVNQTSRNSSGNITEHWEIRFLSKQSSIFTKALESVESMMSCSCMDSVVGHQKFMGMCSLTPASTKSTEPTCYSSLCNFFLYRLADLGVKLDNIDCSTQTTDNFQPCFKITKSTGNNGSTFEGLLKCGGWAEDFLFWLGTVFVLVFCCYSPSFFCLFSQTEVTEDGVNQIVLDGASPVSLQSLMGNYFFSKEDTMWHRARKFIIRVVVLPFPFLGLAMFGEYLQQSFEFLTFKRFAGVLHLLQSGVIACRVCYVILVFYESFFISRSRERNRPCLVCSDLQLDMKSKTIVCQRNLPKNIINHLRIQPQIIVHYWGLFMGYLLNYPAMCFLLIPPFFELSAIFFLRWFLFIVLLFFSPAIIIILLMFMLVVILYFLIFTSPLFVLCDIAGRLRYTQLRDNLFSFPAFLAIYQLLLFAGASMFIAFLSAFVLLLSEPESLPYVASFILVLYYIWSSYSCFINKYRDLALALLKQVKSYKTSRPVEHSQVTAISLETDLLLQNAETTVSTKDNVLKIPKKLFYMACEELMPVRESVCVLILKITILASFVTLVFSVTVLLNVGLTPIMKTLIAFLTGLFPKIVEICRDGGNQKKIEAMIAEEKIPKIVQEYMEGTSAANQQQLNRGSVVDV